MCLLKMFPEMQYEQAALKIHTLRSYDMNFCTEYSEISSSLDVTSIALLSSLARRLLTYGSPEANYRNY